MPSNFSQSQEPPEPAPDKKDFPSMGWSAYQSPEQKKAESDAQTDKETRDSDDAETSDQHKRLRRFKVSLIFVLAAIFVILAWNIFAPPTKVPEIPVTPTSPIALEPPVQILSPEQSLQPEQIEGAQGTPAESENESDREDSSDLVRALIGAIIVSRQAADGQQAQVIIPSGALSTDTRIEIEKVAEGSLTDLYHLKPDGLRFLRPVTIVIPYKESGLRPGQSPTAIQLKYWFAGDARKRFLSFAVDTENKTLRAQVLEF